MRNYITWDLRSTFLWIAALKFQFGNLFTKWRYFVFASLTLTAINGCRGGYVEIPATLNVIELTDVTKVQLLDVVTNFLKKENFNDLGKDKEMIIVVPGFETVTAG
ncbi:hypothetical protein AAKU58_004440 [Oxalobacteraceae bacterium GrIS 1.18]